MGRSALSLEVAGVRARGGFVSQGGCFVEDSRAGKSKKGTTKTAGKKQTGSGCQGGRDLEEEIRSDFKTRGEAELEK